MAVNTTRTNIMKYSALKIQYNKFSLYIIRIFDFFSQSYFFHTLFIITIFSWLILESTNILEINTSTVFNLVFSNDTTSYCFFFFLLIIDLCFLIIAVFPQFLIPNAEFEIPAEKPVKELKGNGNTSSNRRSQIKI